MRGTPRALLPLPAPGPSGGALLVLRLGRVLRLRVLPGLPPAPGHPRVLPQLPGLDRPAPARDVRPLLPVRLASRGRHLPRMRAYRPGPRRRTVPTVPHPGRVPARPGSGSAARGRNPLASAVLRRRHPPPRRRVSPAGAGADGVDPSEEYPAAAVRPAPRHEPGPAARSRAGRPALRRPPAQRAQPARQPARLASLAARPHAVDRGPPGRRARRRRADQSLHRGQRRLRRRSRRRARHSIPRRTRATRRRPARRPRNLDKCPAGRSQPGHPRRGAAMDRRAAPRRPAHPPEGRGHHPRQDRLHRRVPRRRLGPARLAARGHHPGDRPLARRAPCRVLRSRRDPQPVQDPGRTPADLRRPRADAAHRPEAGQPASPHSRKRWPARSARQPAPTPRCASRSP
jgi:hypothetical protein